MDTMYELDRIAERRNLRQIYDLQMALLAVVGGLKLVHDKFATGDNEDEIINMAVSAILDSVKDDAQKALEGIRRTESLREYYDWLPEVK